MIPLYLPVDYEKIELFAVVEFLCLHNPASSHPPTVYTVNDEIDYGRLARLVRFIHIISLRPLHSIHSRRRMVSFLHQPEPAID